MRAVILLALLAATFAFSSAIGCGPEPELYVPPPPPPPRAPAPAPTPSVENRVAAMMETIDRTTFGVETRDPFMQPRPNIDRPMGPSAAVVMPDCDSEVDPLGRVDLGSLELVGLITGTAVPRAMFLAHGGHQAIIVTEGALAGPDCSNRIVDIRDNEVVFQQLTFDESDRVETIISLSENRIPTRMIRIETE